MMIRPGAREFLYRLSKIAHVYALTAADINYARSAVHACNNLNWSNNNDLNISAHIDIRNVYSVRKYDNMAIKKKFEHVIPIHLLEMHKRNNIIIYGVDDRIDVWDDIDMRKVFKISPFTPSNNNPYDLLGIVEYLEILYLKQ